MFEFECVTSFEFNGPDPWLLVRNAQGISSEGYSRMSFSISYRPASLYRTGNIENYSKIRPLLIAVAVVAAER